MMRRQKFELQNPYQLNFSDEACYTKISYHVYTMLENILIMIEI